MNPKLLEYIAGSLIVPIITLFFWLGERRRESEEGIFSVRWRLIIVTLLLVPLIANIVVDNGWPLGTRLAVSILNLFLFIGGVCLIGGRVRRDRQHKS